MVGTQEIRVACASVAFEGVACGSSPQLVPCAAKPTTPMPLLPEQSMLILRVILCWQYLNLYPTSTTTYVFFPFISPRPPFHFFDHSCAVSSQLSPPVMILYAHVELLMSLHPPVHARWSPMKYHRLHLEMLLLCCILNNF